MSCKFDKSRKNACKSAEVCWLSQHYYIILGVSIFFYCILLICCTQMFVNNVESNHNIDKKVLAMDSIRVDLYNQYKNIPDLISVYNEVNNEAKPDSATLLTLKKQEQINKVLLSHLSFTEKQLGDNYADYRQESNNHINKVNGWLAFWIAILALLCGILPLIIQVIQTRKARLEMESLMQDMQNRVNHSQFQTLIDTICVDYSISLFSGENRNTFIRRIGVELSQSLNCMVDMLEKEHDGCGSRVAELYLTLILTEYVKFMDHIIKHADLPLDRLKVIMSLDREVKSLVMDVNNPVKHSRDEVWNRFKNLLPQLSCLTSFF